MATSGRVSSPRTTVLQTPGQNGLTRQDGLVGQGGLAAQGGLARERVTGIQRARLLGALVQVCAEYGVANVTVTHIVDRAGVSRRTFYELFADREDCLLAGLKDGLSRIAARVAPAYQQSGRWRERIRACLIEILCFLDDDPGTGRLVIAETLGAYPEASQQRKRVLCQIMDAVDEGRHEARAGTEPARLTAEGITGGVLSVLHGRLIEENPGSYLELVNPLMSMIVLPYLGPAAARAELTRPTPHTKRPTVPNGTENPLRELHMRLTYRTIRVLLAIAEHPGASNRTIATNAGINDQGQTSKLLTRLEKLGLIPNTGLGHNHGHPNAWTLTQQGHTIHTMLKTRRPARADEKAVAARD